MYGFECFLLNNLEQLCINYANEKLQQHFVAHYLKAQQEEYVTEGLQWSFVRYQDNQGCLDLIEGSPSSIFSLLNEVSLHFLSQRGKSEKDVMYICITNVVTAFIYSFMIILHSERAFLVALMSLFFLSFSSFCLSLSVFLILWPLSVCRPGVSTEQSIGCEAVSCASAEGAVR